MDNTLSEKHTNVIFFTNDCQLDCEYCYEKLNRSPSDIFYTFALYKNSIDMNMTLKRKNIDLPEDTLRKLSLMAVAQGKSLKAYIEQLLDQNERSV